MTTLFMRPFSKLISVDQAVSLVLAVVMYFIIVIVSIGPGFDFVHACSAAIDRYTLVSTDVPSFNRNLCHINLNLNDGMTPHCGVV